ncbi:hypothetical protein ACO22_06501 [Paracoccidioides brasiliensis]|uniref:Uncharacterized protein n=1 Tax=Paracoccidioides brasiliensis TaxID=121759 RepID=A0A1D2J792_PARBR|nr:hypothetical protein ACO22_06501 [Paracoccidioides brasiliensis]
MALRFFSRVAGSAAALVKGKQHGFTMQQLSSTEPDVFLSHKHANIGFSLKNAGSEIRSF